MKSETLTHRKLHLIEEYLHVPRCYFGYYTNSYIIHMLFCKDYFNIVYNVSKCVNMYASYFACNEAGANRIRLSRNRFFTFSMRHILCISKHNLCIHLLYICQNWWLYWRMRIIYTYSHLFGFRITITLKSYPILTSTRLAEAQRLLLK